MKILIKNIDVITSDKKQMLIRNAFIAITDDKITKITQNENELIQFNADKIIDGTNRLAMPGLVNAHTHTPMTILRNYADDLALEDWLFNRIFPAEAKLVESDIYWGSMLAVAEMIQSGTTAFADMYYFSEQTIKAVTESKIKANISKSIYPFEFDQNGPHFFDKRSDFEVFHKTWNNSADGRIKTYGLVHSPYIYDMQSMKDSADFAKSVGSGIHIHILETLKELNDTIAKYGKDGAMAAFDAGIFDVPSIAAHCVHVSDENIKMFKEKNVSVVHNPTSNLKLGSGIARIPDMLNAQVNVALGTDGTSSNNNLNMFEELHLTSLIHKGVHQNPTLVSAEDAIIMATANGAKAIGFGNAGMVKEGMKADLILIDMDKIHLVPNNNPISAVAYSVQASDVDTVIIDGNIVMEKRIFTEIDVERAKYEVVKIAQRIN